MTHKDELLLLALVLLVPVWTFTWYKLGFTRHLRLAILFTFAALFFLHLI